MIPEGSKFNLIWGRKNKKKLNELVCTRNYNYLLLKMINNWVASCYIIVSTMLGQTKFNFFLRTLEVQIVKNTFVIFYIDI